MTREESARLLATPIIDLLLTVEEQKPYAQKILGENATPADVLKEAQRRVARARELRSQLEKALGTSSRPYPMWGLQRVETADTITIERDLSHIASDSNSMKVYSARPYNEVMALAYCDMPVPSMLPLFFDGLERRKPESRNRTQMLIGNPGHGKSYMGASHGRMRKDGSVEVYDCGGKNMNDLLFEMVLDFGAGDALPTAIDKRLKAGTLEAPSLALLKGLDNKYVTIKDGEIVSIDWAAMKQGGDKAATEEIYGILMKVSKIERLNGAGGNTLGMNSQYGPLIRAFLENREIVLDEYNKSREGSDNALQTVWQFLNGEIDACTVDNPLKNKDASSGPSSFTFRREDLGIGFFVTLTGNKTEDGVTTRSLNKSVYSRLSPDTLPDPNEADWWHRICQMMVGVPVSTLYMTFKEQADANPAAFGEWLLALRREKARIEGVAVPELQETLLLNWRNVISSTEKLAKFYSAWATVTDSEKLISNEYSDLVMEVDEEYSKKEGVDFRKIKQHLEAAIPIRPRMESTDAPAYMDFKNFMKPPVIAEEEKESLSLNFGTRLIEYIERVVYEKSEAIGKPKLYARLQEVMKNSGLRDIHLNEAERSAQKSAEESLNISSFRDSDLRKQAELARKVFCRYLRQQDQITLRQQGQIMSGDDEDITSVEKMRAALEWVKGKDTAKTKEMFIINSDTETLVSKLFAPVHVYDEATVDTGSEEGVVLDFDNLVSHDDFLASLALPTISDQNLQAIWDTNLRPRWDDLANDNKPPVAGNKLDEGLHISENTSETGIAMTTLCVLFKDSVGDDRDVLVHVVRNARMGKTLVVSEKAPTKLLAAFKEAGITHVDRHDENAASKVNSALHCIIRGVSGDSKKLMSHMKDAFFYRNNHFSAERRSSGEALANFMVEPGISLSSEDRGGDTLVKVLLKGTPKSAGSKK